MKRQVVSSIWLTPSVLLPLAGGVAAGVASVVLGGVPLLTGAAVVGIGGGLVWMVARVVLNVDRLTAGAIEAGQAEAARREKLELDQLERLLRTDRDHRTQEYLSLLRSLRDELQTLLKKPGLETRTAELREQVAAGFARAVACLRESFRLWEAAGNTAGDDRQRILDEREKVLQEIPPFIDQLRGIVSHFKDAGRDGSEVDWQQLRDDLDASLRVARRTEERVRELDGPNQNTNPESYSRE